MGMLPEMSFFFSNPLFSSSIAISMLQQQIKNFQVFCEIDLFLYKILNYFRHGKR